MSRMVVVSVDNPGPKYVTTKEQLSPGLYALAQPVKGTSNDLAGSISTPIPSTVATTVPLFVME